jgi:uncharacterized integral membrane protein
VGFAAAVIVAIVAAAVAVFALQNATPTQVTFLAWSTREVPVSGLVLAALAAGIVVAGVPLWVQRWRLRARARTLERRVAELEQRATAAESLARESAATRETPPRQSAAS